MLHLHYIGTRLSDRIPEIVERYQRDLLEVANPLGTTPELWAESRTHAAVMLGACARVFELPDDRATGRNLEEDLLASSVIGGLWACCKARLTDSLSAMEALVRNTLDAVVEISAEIPQVHRAAVIARAAKVVNQIGSLHAQTAALSYDAFLLQQIEQANSDDRSRLARDIHDCLGNSLVLAFRHLELYRTKSAGVNPAGEQHLDSILDSLKEATSFTRGLISGLRAEAPLTNLAEAVTGCAAALNFRDLPVHISVHGDETWLPEDHRDELFLIIREFLRNSFAHAVPEAVSVRIRISPGRADVEAFDNGRGFIFDERRWASEATATPAGRSRGTGLSVMRERTEQLGGQFSLTTRLGKGTRIRLWVPLPKRTHGDAAAAPRTESSSVPQRASVV